MKHFFIPILISFSLFSSCTHNTTPPSIIPPPPKHTESAIPSITKAGSDVVETIKTNTKIGEKLEEQKKIVIEQRVEIEDALAQAEKIKEKALAKQLITELEAMSLLEQLKKVEARNLFLEQQNDDLETIRDEQDKLLSLVQKTLDKTKEQIINKEHETDSLIEQNVFLSKNLQLKSSEVEGIKKDLMKKNEQLASANVYKRWVIGIISAFIAWTILKNILMIYLPSTKFRI